MNITATSENVGDLFDGVMLTVDDFPSGKQHIPGWRCKACGWTCGTVGLPFPHECTADQPSDIKEKVGSL